MLLDHSSRSPGLAPATLVDLIRPHLGWLSRLMCDWRRARTQMRAQLKMQRDLDRLDESHLRDMGLRRVVASTNWQQPVRGMPALPLVRYDYERDPATGK